MVLTMDGPVRVLRNDVKRSGHWLTVGLRAEGPNRDGIGALVTVVAGDRRWSAELHRSGGFQAALPARVAFGLGAVESIDRVEIRWPAGHRQVVSNPKMDSLLWIQEEVQ